MIVSKIFINYRREDSRGEARALYDRLSVRFPGRVFMDVSVLEPGVDFVQAIDQEVSSCDAFVAVIGKDWACARLQDTQDFVRLEIASALKRNIPVIPALVGGAVMPSATDLPSDLQPLLRRNAVYLTDQGWEDDVKRLIVALERVLSKSMQGAPKTSRRVWPWVVSAAGALTVILLAVVLVPRLSTPPAAGTSNQISDDSKPLQPIVNAGRENDSDSSRTNSRKPGVRSGEGSESRLPKVNVADKKPIDPDPTGSSDEANSSAQTTAYPARPETGSSEDWSNAVIVGNLILKYQSSSGAAAVDRIEPTGRHTTIKQYPAGAFAPGWSVIVNTGHGILYYNRDTGAAALGRLDAAGNHTTLRSYTPLSSGWTNIVPTPNGILFYNRNTGSGAVGRIDASGNYATIRSYRDGDFAKGWTNISYTARGIEYRNASTGATVVGYIDANGNHVTR